MTRCSKRPANWAFLIPLLNCLTEISKPLKSTAATAVEIFSSAKGTQRNFNVVPDDAKFQL
jgi:hypothetical protein